MSCYAATASQDFCRRHFELPQTPYGRSSPFDAYRAAMAMRLDDTTIARVACPTLITDPDHEQFWPGQSKELYDKLTCEKQLVRFTEAEGADWHCEVAARGFVTSGSSTGSTTS